MTPSRPTAWSRSTHTWPAAWPGEGSPPRLPGHERWWARAGAAVAALAAAMLTGAPALGQGGDSNLRIYSDPAGDAVIRRTDVGNNAAIRPDTVLPDLLRVELMGWMPSSPLVDPYTGTITHHNSSHIFRMNVVFNGLVNPPGQLVPGTQFNAFEYGPSPVYGFIELNVDRDRDTGGQLPGPAQHRYLANVGRFGALPTGSISVRAARSAADYDLNFWSTPHYERSGEDFALVLCGCYPVTVVSAGGNGDLTFEAGETWILQGRFFQRAAGFQEASNMLGGTDIGLYEPIVRLRWSHDIVSDTTMVTLVFPLTMQGASILTGQPQQPMDTVYDIGGNHFSLREGVQDLVNAANGLNGPLSGPAQVLTQRWNRTGSDEVLDPTDWRVSALVGTTYAEYQPSLYVWTDVGFENPVGDCDGDGFVNDSDRTVIESYIAANDGGPLDGDGVVNGRVQIINFAANFHHLDIDGDGFIGQEDVALIGGTCAGDWNGDGVTTSADISAFLMDWLSSLSLGTLDGDFNGDLVVNSADISAFLQAWLACLR